VISPYHRGSRARTFSAGGGYPASSRRRARVKDGDPAAGQAEQAAVRELAQGLRASLAGGAGQGGELFVGEGDLRVAGPRPELGGGGVGAGGERGQGGGDALGDGLEDAVGQALFKGGK
jgi:hypothetical protein